LGRLPLAPHSPDPTIDTIPQRRGISQPLAPAEDSRFMPKVTFLLPNNEKKEIDVPAGSNLRKEARAAGVPLYRGLDRFLNCRGIGLCGTCKVYVKSGMENLGPKPFMERMNGRMHPLTMLALIEHEDELRLACQCTVNGDCTVAVRPEFNWYGENFWQ